MDARHQLLADPERIRELASKQGTPLYLVDSGRVVRALNTLRDGLGREYARSELTYSVKSNYLTGLLTAVLAAGYRLEVVSRREWEHARRAGARPEQILFNGPVKSAADLSACRETGVAVNADSLEELEQAARLGTSAEPFPVGLRIMVRLRSGAPSRFGLDLDEAETLAAVRGLMTAGSLRVTGLHLHHSSRRDAQSYCERLDFLLDAARRLDLRPEYLDLGGGLASQPPPELAARLPYVIDSPEEFCATLGAHARRVLGAEGPRLILEPGIGVLAPAMNYVTSIVAVKKHAAICDGSMFDVNPLRSAVAPPCHLLPAAGGAPRESLAQPLPLTGGTCMEIDRPGEFAAGGPAPRAGDLAVITNVGAYSACLAPDFIVPRAAIWDVDRQEPWRAPEPVGVFGGAGA